MNDYCDVINFKRFRPCIIGNAKMELLRTGLRWGEGPVWFADGQCSAFEAQDLFGATWAIRSCCRGCGAQASASVANSATTIRRSCKKFMIARGLSDARKG